MCQNAFNVEPQLHLRKYVLDGRALKKNLASHSTKIVLPLKKGAISLTALFLKKKYFIFTFIMDVPWEGLVGFAVICSYSYRLVERAFPAICTSFKLFLVDKERLAFLAPPVSFFCPSKCLCTALDPKASKTC